MTRLSSGRRKVFTDKNDEILITNIVGGRRYTRNKWQREVEYWSLSRWSLSIGKDSEARKIDTTSTNQQRVGKI